MDLPLNRQAWTQLAAVVDGAAVPGAETLEQACWTSHLAGDPFLELGSDAVPWLRRAVREYVAARIRINLVLYALDQAGQPWTGKLGHPADGSTASPAEELRHFLLHVETHRPSLQAAVAAVNGGNGSALALARRIADQEPRLLAADSGPPQNLYYFLRFALGQLQAREAGMKSYDQAYLWPSRTDRTRRHGPSTRAPDAPPPGPLLLPLGGRSVHRVEDLRRYLAAYGIRAPAGSLQGGAAARHLERLGLVVDSPDAGGGRLLVDPFPV